MWMLPLYLHVNKKSDDEEDDDDDGHLVHGLLEVFTLMLRLNMIKLISKQLEAFSCPIWLRYQLAT